MFILMAITGGRRERIKQEKLARIQELEADIAGYGEKISGHKIQLQQLLRDLDKLKAEVPIWKREVWADGTSTWVDPGKR